jgi:hypothetical protein
MAAFPPLVRGNRCFAEQVWALAARRPAPMPCLADPVHRAPRQPRRCWAVARGARQGPVGTGKGAIAARVRSPASTLVRSADALP